MADTIKVVADREDIVAVADAVRSKTGKAAKLSIEEITKEIYGLQIPATLNI